MKRIKLKRNSMEEDNHFKSKISSYLSKGLSLKDACTLTKCSQARLLKLRHDPDFENMIQSSIARDKEEHLDIIRNSGDWRASTWYLERKFSEEFGKVDLVKHEMTIKVQTLQKVLINVINEELKDLPQVKFKIINRLRTYSFDGSDMMDHSLKPKEIAQETYDLQEE